MEIQTFLEAQNQSFIAPGDLKQGEGRPKGVDLPVNVTKGCWNKNKT